MSQGILSAENTVQGDGIFLSRFIVPRMIESGIFSCSFYPKCHWVTQKTQIDRSVVLIFVYKGITEVDFRIAKIVWRIWVIRKGNLSQDV
ncbi:MAG: hypothetical protein AYP45_09705 [Candidatus Brocadia carolinensis]|uniref:Uncharacterized protein n=1 Tax=Candidatus Brocadia carolinensis TaxID=1004156 RepID=A0A1V4AT61_9BACT|nr:MAG: hypothetical protein AYP45_09705 [Candidatus Brocadia caroliniensis]